MKFLPTHKMELFSIPILYAIVMASFDVVMLAIIKAYSIGWLKSVKWMILPTLAYALQPWIFLKALSFESMIVMNLLWDLVSDVLVTFNGAIVFKEKLSYTKIAGVITSLLGMYLLSCEKAEAC